MVGPAPAGTVLGLKLATAPSGRPLTVKVTALPGGGVTVRTKFATPPGTMFADVGAPCAGPMLNDEIACPRAALVAGAKLASPEYCAVMVWLPTVRAEVVYVAMPVATVPEPSWVVPSQKVTVPVGVPAGELTAAVKVTAWPVPAGFCDDVTATVGVAGLTVSVTEAVAEL